MGDFVGPYRADGVSPRRHAPGDVCREKAGDGDLHGDSGDRDPHREDSAEALRLIGEALGLAVPVRRDGPGNYAKLVQIRTRLSAAYYEIERRGAA